MLLLFEPGIMTIAIIGGALYYGLKYMGLAGVSESRIKQDLANMAQTVAQTPAELVPVDQEHMELLSYHIKKEKRSKLPWKGTQGIYTTVYQEDFAVFTSHKYSGSKGLVLLNKYQLPTLLVARTSRNEYVMRAHKEGLSLYIDRQEAGMLHTNGTLFFPRSRKVMAQLRSQGQLLFLDLGNREAGLIADPGASASPYPRVFEYVKAQNDDERAVVLALALLLMSSEIQ